MFCPNCGKELPDGSKFCGFCGADISKEQKGNDAINGGMNDAATGMGGQSFGGYDPLGNGQGMSQPDNGQFYGGQNTNQYGGQFNQFDNNQYSGGQFDNNQYYNNNQYGAQQFGAQNPNMQYGAYGPMNQQPQPPKKSKKGIIAAIVSVILVLVIGGSAAAYHFISADKAKKKDDDDDKKIDVATSASTEEEEKKDDSSNAATEATTEPEEEEISGEEALELACENLSKVKDMTTEFSYVMECTMAAPDEGVSGDVVESAEFKIVTDYDVNAKNSDADALELAEGTVSREILGVEFDQEISVFRGDISGSYVSGIEYDTGERYVASESEVVTELLGFYDYDVYKAELQDKTEKVDGVECYVYVSEDTYDQGGISGVFSPISGIYNGDTDLCTVTIYVSKEDAQLVKVETEFTDIQDEPLQDSLRTYTGADDIEFTMDKLEYSLTFVEFDTGVDIDPDFEDLDDETVNVYTSFMLYLGGLLEMGDFDFTDTDDDVTEDDKTKYITDTYGALTYEVPEDWYGQEVDMSDDMSGYIYAPDKNAMSGILVMYSEVDTTSLTDSQLKQGIDSVLIYVADSYGVSYDEKDIKKGTVNGGYAENVRGPVDGSDMEMDIMVFETGGSGIGIVIFISEDIENSEYLAQYYHLLESLEF
ncbi:zinc-ribbon domain-containing protein [Butyrivibrio fibrisolvens DSM 3071]|uniref:Zinc-ribbon domain-containing protein n=1 Tax=Butyrivibrio fibrisolvens DSM 3071 TaxID=1121131 RepID=A0A1M6DWX7_BUTFI|nr:zinc ribbon domain-containing protein [Butyrivibrio fibrisolvens]SHI77702.1 zinc-ribbon domain-containing protein [Butyrivibrio fibrisolvens DSM 3071]